MLSLSLPRLYCQLPILGERKLEGIPKTQMKRSPSFSSSSSSSSCIESNPIDHQSEKPKITKRVRAKKNQNLKLEKCEISPQSPNLGRRSSIYRGVTRHRWTGRYEAHLWDKSTWNSIQNKRGRQIYLGAYDNEEAAAHTYDHAALKYWGADTILNFPIETYSKEFEEMQKLSKEEYLASLRRRSSGFSRGVSKYRGVARHHHNGRWEARIGRVFGNKYLYLGTYIKVVTPLCLKNTQEEAAAAYDMAAIEYRGPNAVTNFDISFYADHLKNKTKQDPSNPNPNPNPSTTDHDQIQSQHQEQGDHEDRTVLLPEQFLNLELPPPYEHNSPASVLMMDPADEHEHPWSLCLDTGGYNYPMPVPDIPLESRSGDMLPDLFGDTGFEDDIDFMFDECKMEGMFGDTDYGVDAEIFVGTEQEVQEGPVSPFPSTSSSSSSLTLTTSVSCT